MPYIYCEWSQARNDVTISFVIHYALVIVVTYVQMDHFLRLAFSHCGSRMTVLWRPSLKVTHSQRCPVLLPNPTRVTRTATRMIWKVKHLSLSLQRNKNEVVKEMLLINVCVRMCAYF